MENSALNSHYVIRYYLANPSDYFDQSGSKCRPVLSRMQRGVRRILGKMITPKWSRSGRPRFEAHSRGDNDSWWQCRSTWRRERWRQAATTPHVEDRRIDHELHDRRGDDAAHHRRRDPLHDVGASAIAPENRQESGDDDRGRHGFRSHAFYRAMIDRIPEAGRRGELT